MPRRNRNVHAPRINTDELAEQAAQLTAEFEPTGSRPAYIAVDEMQLYVDSFFGPGKPFPLHDYITHWISNRSGTQIRLINGKAVTSNGHI